MAPYTEFAVDRPVLLCGLGKVGWRVLDFLRAAGTPVVAIDVRADPEDPRLAGIRYVKGDCRNPLVLERAGVATAEGILIVTSDDLVNVATALAVRRLNPTSRIVVRMFNPGLIERLGSAIQNTTALSVSALTAPLIAMTAVTGDALGAFSADGVPQQIAEVAVDVGSELAGRRLTDVAEQHKILVLAFTPAAGEPQRLHDVPGDAKLEVGDRFVACGHPTDLEPLLAHGRGDLLSGVLWASAIRRWLRTARRTLADVDLGVKIGATALLLTVAGSTLVFRFGVDLPWGDAIYQTVSVIATGGDLHGENRPEWFKVFLSGLKLTGTALVAAFTAILTNFLLRAKLGGAFETRKIPDGGHIVVCGLGNVGFRVVQELVRLGHRVVAVEKANDNPFAATVRRMGVPVVIGDATEPEVLAQVRANTARAIVATVESELANLEIALLARQTTPNQRVVVRLTDPDFAQALRDAAGVKLAIATPAVAAPAFAAALYGDRVHTLIPVGDRTLAVAELTIQTDDPCLAGQSLVAAMIDYRFLPLAIGGKEPFAASGIPRTHRIAAGEKLTVAIGRVGLERLLSRQSASREWSIRVDSFPPTAVEALLPVVRAARSCSGDEAMALLKAGEFELARGRTRGEAEELLARVARERAKARILPTEDPQ